MHKQHWSRIWSRWSNDELLSAHSSKQSNAHTMYAAWKARNIPYRRSAGAIHLVKKEPVITLVREPMVTS